MLIRALKCLNHGKNSISTVCLFVPRSYWIPISPITFRQKILGSSFFFVCHTRFRELAITIEINLSRVIFLEKLCTMVVFYCLPLAGLVRLVAFFCSRLWSFSSCQNICMFKIITRVGTTNSILALITTLIYLNKYCPLFNCFATFPNEYLNISNYFIGFVC